MNNTVLKHHGIQGMHWGIRRYQNKDGTLTPKGEAHRRKMMKKNVHKMSDQELSSQINRMQQEKKYKDLVDDSTKSYGRKEAERVLKRTGEVVATTAIIGATAYAGKMLVSHEPQVERLVKDKSKTTKQKLKYGLKKGKEKVDWNEAANYMFPNPNKKKK